MVTIKDVAKKAGVSIATVSYALNDKNSVSEEMKKKIRQIAEEMGYMPNSLAQGLLFKKTNIIGLIVPDVSSAYMAKVIKHLEAYARAENYFLLLGSTSNRPETETAIINSFLGKNIDSLIIFPGNYHDPEFYREIAVKLNKRHIPFVFANLSFPEIKSNFVVPDLEEGEYQVTRYLLDNGIRDMVFVGGERSHYYSRIRYEGFLRALRENNLEDSTNNYAVCGEGYTFSDGYRVIREYPAERKIPQAFVCVNDLVAYGVIKGLREKGLRVPEDVSVVGFDDLELPTLDEVPLTTVRIPVEELARLCIETLKENGGKRVLRQFILQPELIVRQSAVEKQA